MEFYSEIVKYYEAIFPLGTVKELFVKDKVSQNHYKTLLDVGCATGAFSATMAKYFTKVEAFDLDEDMIKRAKMFYKYNNLDYSVGNMLDIDGLYKEQRFDLITCFGNTLVHLKQDEIIKVLTSIKKHLAENGEFILQILNYDYVYEAGIKKLPPIDNDQVRFDRYYDLTNKHTIEFKTVLTVKSTKEQMNHCIVLYPIFKDDLDRWLEKAGFSNRLYYKNYKGESYDGKHLPLIVVAK